MTLDELIADDVAQRASPFVVEGCGRPLTVWSARLALNAAERRQRQYTGEAIRITRGGRLLWPRPSVNTGER